MDISLKCDTGEGDSSSAGSDAAPPTDPVAAQLINNITMLDYRSLGKTTPLIDDGVNLINNYFYLMKSFISIHIIVTYTNMLKL